MQGQLLYNPVDLFFCQTNSRLFDWFKQLEVVKNSNFKWSQSRLHSGARVLLFEVLVMLCWLPERKCFLPLLLTELLGASTTFLSSTQPKLSEIKSAAEFGALIGFGCGTVDEMLIEETVHYQVNNINFKKNFN